MIRIFLIVLVIFSSCFQKSIGQEIEITGYREHTKIKTFNSLGVNYYFSNMFRLGISYQNYQNTKYSYEIFNEGSSYTDEFFGTPNVNSFELNFSIILNKSEENYRYGIGFKPSIHYNNGISNIVSRSVSYIDDENSEFREIISINDFKISNSVIIIGKLDNIFKSNFSITGEIEAGFFLIDYFESRHNNSYRFIEIFPGFSRLSLGISYRFNKKIKTEDNIF